MADIIRRSFMLAGASFGASLLGGCLFDGSDDSAPPPDDPVDPQEPPPESTITGTLHAYGVAGAQVSAYDASADGLPKGDPLATTTTDATGAFSLPLATTPAGAVVVVADGGDYTSPVDKTTQSPGTLSTLLPSVGKGTQSVAVTVLSDLVAAAASLRLKAGASDLKSALSGAAKAIQALLGLGDLAGDPATIAVDTGATQGDGWWLAALTGSLEQLRANGTLSAASLLEALRDDAADALLDGRRSGKAITLPGGSTALAPSLFTTEWSGAANAWGKSEPAYAEATGSISGALQNAAQALGIAIGSSGSIAPLQTQDAGTRIYFAARTDGLVELDMQDPDKPVATQLKKINDAVMVGATGGFFTSLDGIVINPTPINTAAGPKVFALLYSYGSSTVVAVNLTDGTVSESADLPIKTIANFSGARASIAGGIADGRRGLIWLATGDGLYGVDPSDLGARPVAIAQPSGTQINENLGGDPAKDIVYSPDYLNRGLVIFNLAERRAYWMDDIDWVSTVGSFATASGEVDGVALDSRYNVAVMTLEGAGTIGVLAYETPQGAKGSVGSLAASKRFRSFQTGGFYAGSAIDPVSHTGLFVGESTSLGVGVLDDPAGSQWQGFERFVRADRASYRFSPHDPHTVGAFNIGQKPYGFVLQGTFGSYQVGVIDLQAWLKAPASNGSLDADPMTDPSIVKLMSY